MHYIGIDLHKHDLVVAVEDDNGPMGKPKRIRCCDEAEIGTFVGKLRPFTAVIEASASYRWLYDRLASLGSVVLAHPLRLRAIVAGRAKTDKLDAALLAALLRAGLIPTAYVPPKRFEQLRDLTRSRARLSQAATLAKNQLHALLRRGNRQAPFRNVFCKRGRRWLAKQTFGLVGNMVRDELLLRLDHYDQELGKLDEALVRHAEQFPEVGALTGIHGIGLYSALLIIAELGEVDRFRSPRQIGAYAGLTARVHQSGSHDYHGHITRQGSHWLRWVLVQVAMKAPRKDAKLRSFYTRIRKRSSKHVARVAVARKLAGICWVRLRRWHRHYAAAGS
jgi:transposase